MRLHATPIELILLINNRLSLCDSVANRCEPTVILGGTERKLALPAHWKKLYVRGTTVRDSCVSVITIKLIPQFARPICFDKDRLLACHPVMITDVARFITFHNFHRHYYCVDDIRFAWWRNQAALKTVCFNDNIIKFHICSKGCLRLVI